jgi:hypothetical protein
MARAPRSRDQHPKQAHFSEGNRNILSHIEIGSHRTPQDGRSGVRARVVALQAPKRRVRFPDGLGGAFGLVVDPVAPWRERVFRPEQGTRFEQLRSRSIGVWVKIAVQKSAEYWHHAADLVKLAAKTRDVANKAALISMAGSWRELASCMNRLEIMDEALATDRRDPPSRGKRPL